MISVKILGCILVFSACALGGYAFKNKISMRVSELENMMSCLIVIENEIRVYMSDIITASDKVLSVAKSTNHKLFSTIIELVKQNDGQPLSELWKNSVVTASDQSVYTQEDINLFMKFGNVLGSGDAQSQIESLNFLKSELSNHLNDAKQSAEKSGVLFGKVGVYIGVIAVVLLI